MDVVGRLDLLDFFKQECSERGATIIYATHIFDGMETWPTHMAYVENGKMIRGGAMNEITGLQRDKKLLHTVEVWLREEKENRRKREQDGGEKVPQRKGPVFPSRHMAFFR